MTSRTEANRWLSLAILCLGELMIVLDGTVVNVALPSIQSDLHFSDTGLVWVVNAYLLTFGGCLMLGGRLGDLYGSRKMFLLGLVLFTLASLACGLAPSQTALVLGRAAQGVGAAIVTAVVLALIVTTFPDPLEQGKAMGFYGFVASAGGSIGVLVGGFLVSWFNWHWIFLVNVPIGLGVYLLCLRLIPASPRMDKDQKLDFVGAILITLASMLAIYGIVGGNEAGWFAPATLVPLGGAFALLAFFVIYEKRVTHPLVPLEMFGNATIVLSNVMAALWAAAMFAWFFMAALYMQLVLHYTPMQIGLGFLPANLIMGAFSLGLSAKLIEWFGLKRPLWIGLSIAGLGLLLFARAPVAGEMWRDIVPGMLLLGTGAGVAFNPLLQIAMNETDAALSGLASGLVNMSFMMGGALGLAVLAAIAAAQTGAANDPAALARGYGLAFLVGAAAAFVAVLIALVWLKPKQATGAAPRLH